MDNKTIQEIIEINSHFYESYAKEFSVTRQAPWKGWSKLVDFLDFKNTKILDLGCGNGRFYKFLTSIDCVGIDYYGVDISKSLIEEAKVTYPKATFGVEDFIIKNNKNVDAFDTVTGFGIMHHIPSHKVRINFITDAASYLKPDGVLVLTFWNKTPDQNKQKITHEIALEKNDYLVEWDKDINKYRYVHVFYSEEIETIKQHANQIGLKLVKEFSADGKEGNSNIYLIWRKYA